MKKQGNMNIKKKFIIIHVIKMLYKIKNLKILMMMKKFLHIEMNISKNVMMKMPEKKQNIKVGKLNMK